MHRRFLFFFATVSVNDKTTPELRKLSHLHGKSWCPLTILEMENIHYCFSGGGGDGEHLAIGNGKKKKKQKKGVGGRGGRVVPLLKKGL